MRSSLARIDVHDIFHLAILLVVLGLLDKTLFLAARGEHYWTTLVIFFLAGDALTEAFVPGAKAVHDALWFWAGVSKLNHHFPSVVGVMTSNNPFTRLGAIRRLMYRSYPDDMRPSQVAVLAGHAGTALEIAVPLVLVTSHGGLQTYVGLALLLGLHGFITSNIPMGVPLEWNVIMVYGGFYLFWKNAAVSVLSMSPLTAAVVLAMCVVLPILGNLFPGRVPFLLAMRYYAGNWAYTVWLFRGDSYRKLEKLTKSSAWVIDQLLRLYGKSTAIALVGKTMGFRLMHLHGRVLGKLVPRLVDDLSEYEWVDGELVAGMVLGWNFGGGHLSREELLAAVQAQCNFAPGELRVAMVEAQPLGGASLHWRLHDAATGLIEEGHAKVSELRERQPWDQT